MQVRKIEDLLLMKIKNKIFKCIKVCNYSKIRKILNKINKISSKMCKHRNKQFNQLFTLRNQTKPNKIKIPPQ